MLTLEQLQCHYRANDLFSTSLDIELVEVGKEHSIAIMPLTPRHRNGMGNAHGGAIFSLVDMAFAAVSNCGGVYCVNAQSSISYLNPGRVGPLKAVARKIHAGRRMGTYEVRVTDGDETLIAVATITGYTTSTPIPL